MQVLQQNKFPLIVDESRDLSTIKHICLRVIYNNDLRKIKNNFFSLKPLSSRKANTLYTKIVDERIKYEISLKNNLIVIVLKNDVPPLFII